MQQLDEQLGVWLAQHGAEHQRHLRSHQELLRGARSMWILAVGLVMLTMVNVGLTVAQLVMLAHR